jgi:hypothetical protein
LYSKNAAKVETEIVWSFVVQYTTARPATSLTNWCADTLEDMESIQVADRSAGETEKKTRRKVRVTAPRKGDKRKLMSWPPTMRARCSKSCGQWLADEAPDYGFAVNSAAGFLDRASTLT